MTMADTVENQKEYPQQQGQLKGCGFPIMRCVMLFCLGTGGDWILRRPPFVASRPERTACCKRSSDCFSWLLPRAGACCRGCGRVLSGRSPLADNTLPPGRVARNERGGPGGGTPPSRQSLGSGRAWGPSLVERRSRYREDPKKRRTGAGDRSPVGRSRPPHPRPLSPEKPGERGAKLVFLPSRKTFRASSFAASPLGNRRYFSGSAKRL